jgi:tetratricopeptide (TPR) repeat protein
MSQKILNNRYKITREIGRGGFGITYLAEDKNNANSLCVVKQLNPYHAEISTTKRLFQREADTLKELKEADQIPDFIEYFEEEENYFIAQEYIEGKTLDTLISENWDSENLSRFLWDVLSVLEKLHKNNIIHRDIKPSNLIKSDRNCKIVVIDFGAVKQLDISPNNLNSVRENQALNPPTGTRVATAEYAPWEQKQGKPLLNSDIYALGMTALQLITKKSPIDIKRDDKDNIVLEKPLNNIDTPLLAIINKMVKNDSTKRYQSAAEVLKAIDTRSKEPPKQIIISKKQQSLLSTVNNQGIDRTQPLLSTVNYPAVDQAQPLSTSPNNQFNGENINSSSREKLSNTEENHNHQEPRNLNHNIHNSDDDNPQINSTINLSSTNQKNKLFLIPLSAIALIIIVSEFISPWIRPAYFIHQGNKLLDRNKAEESLAQFDKATSLKENSFDGWKGRGDALFSLGRVSGALGAYEKANILNPNNVKTLNNLGKVYYEQGNYQAALDAHQKVLEIDSQNAEALSGQGITYLGSQDYEKSLAAFDEAKKIKPNEPDIWLKKAIVLRYLNRPEEAEELYKEALSVYESLTKDNENDSILWTDRGFVLQQLNRQQEALESYEKALTIDENFYEALLGKANTLILLQKPEDALSTLEKAASIRPKDYQVWYTQGTILEQVLKRHQEALNALDKATEFNPKFAPAWLNKGLSLIALERYEEALNALDKAKDLEPQNPYVWQNRGLVLQALGRQSESNASYQKARELGFPATAP